MAEIALAVAGISAIAGTVVSFIGQQKAGKAAQKAEDLKKQQLNLESKRAQRNEIRQAMLRRSQLATQAESQGVAESSAISGAQASVTQRAGSNILFNNQATQIGNELFAAYKEKQKGDTLASIGQGISSLSSAFG
jgi:Flp pilus assembly protein TadB